MDEERITKVITSHLEPISIKLARDVKGNYKWEIEVHTDNKEEAIGLLKALDKMLREKFIEKEEPAQYVGRASDISEPKVVKEEPEIFKIKRGKVAYANAKIFENEIIIKPNFNIKRNDRAIGFLINSLKSISEKEKFDFQIKEENNLLKEIVIKGKIKEDTMKNIFGKIAWSFEKSIEKPLVEEEEDGSKIR